LKGSGLSLIEVSPWHLLGAAEETTKTLVGVAGDPAEVRTEHFPSTSPERYLETILFGLTNYIRAGIVIQNQVIEIN
jgi:hypothetical protein